MSPQDTIEIVVLMETLRASAQFNGRSRAVARKTLTTDDRLAADAQETNAILQTVREKRSYV